MIDPHPGQRGIVGEQHGLTKLLTTLETLDAGQRVQQTRDTQLQAHLTTQATTLTQMGRGLRWLRWSVGALLVVMLGLSGLVGWQLGRTPPLDYARALGVIDGILQQQWPTLPKGAQEQLSSVYSRLGLPSPGERQPARK
jgi:hypothetical protein